MKLFTHPFAAIGKVCHATTSPTACGGEIHCRTHEVGIHDRGPEISLGAVVVDKRLILGMMVVLVAVVVVLGSPKDITHLFRIILFLRMRG